MQFNRTLKDMRDQVVCRQKNSTERGYIIRKGESVLGCWRGSWEVVGRANVE